MAKVEEVETTFALQGQQLVGVDGLIDAGEVELEAVKP